MKSVILYWEQAPAHRRTRTPVKHAGKVLGYIRHEIIKGDALHALDKAKPKIGETVLNSVELPLI